MRNFDDVLADIRLSPVHAEHARGARRARLVSAGGLLVGGLLGGAGVTGFAVASAGVALPLAGVVAGIVLAGLGLRQLVVYRNRVAVADRALFLDTLRHARTLEDLRAAGFIDPSEFMFDLMPVEEKLDVSPEPGIPMGPECACDEVDLEGEFKGMEEMAKKLGYGESK